MNVLLKSRLRLLSACSGGAAGVSHDDPENSKRAFWTAPTLQTPPIFHENTPRERTQRVTLQPGFVLLLFLLLLLQLFQNHPEQFYNWLDPLMTPPKKKEERIAGIRKTLYMLFVPKEAFRSFAERDSKTHRNTDTQRNTETHNTQRNTHRNTHKHTQRNTHTRRNTQRESHTQKHTHTHSKKHKLAEKDKRGKRTKGGGGESQRKGGGRRGEGRERDQEGERTEIVPPPIRALSTNQIMRRVTTSQEQQQGQDRVSMSACEM